MRVKIYDVDGYGQQTANATCATCSPTSPSTPGPRAELRERGRWWMGGHDLPLVRLVRACPPHTGAVADHIR